MSLIDSYIFVPAEATVTEALCAYLDREANWWWFLVTRKEDAYAVCSFGSLLPYLTGKTPHIVHMPDACPICSGVDPVYWGNTTEQVEEALAMPGVRARQVGDLPMAPMYTITVEEYDREHAPISLWEQRLHSNPYGITDSARLISIHHTDTKSMDMGLGGASIPAF